MKTKNVSVIVFYFQILIIALSLIYIGFIILMNDYFESTPPILVILSFNISVIYVCAIGYMKIDKDAVEKFQGVIADENTLDAARMIYTLVIFLAILITIICFFFVHKMSTRLGDILAILTLIFTLCVEMITNLLTQLICKNMINPRSKNY